MFESYIEEIYKTVVKAQYHAPKDRDAREMYYRQVIGDIVDGLTSVVPADRTFQPQPPAEKKVSAKYASIIGDMMIVAKAKIKQRTFCADANYETDNDGHFKVGYVCFVSEKDDKEGRLLARIDFNPKVQGTLCRKMMLGILSGITSYYGHQYRRRANKQARKSADQQ